MHKLLIFGVAAASLMVGGAASAADVGRPVTAQPAALPPAPPPLSWTGFYLGGDIGGVWTRSVSGRWDPPPTTPALGVLPITGSLNTSALVGGVHGGYNWQFAPAFVAGIEGDWSWTTANTTFIQSWVSTITGVRPAALTRMNIVDNWLASIRGRIGYLVTPATLVYFTGGGAWGQVGYTASAANETSTYVATSALSKTVSGSVLGGGLEYVFSNNWSVRAEYLFYHLDTGASAIAPDSTGHFLTLPSRFTWSNSDVQSARAGVSYKF
jgi:outer membrane immunogenic protein